MKKTEITTSARIHLGLIEMNGEFGRKNMSLGITLRNPQWRVIVTSSRQRQLVWGTHLPSREEELKVLLDKLSSDLVPPHQNFKLNIYEGIPANIGLGSTTSLYMAIALSLNKHFGTNLSNTEICTIIKRGGTSGISFLGTMHSGLLLDSGSALPSAPPYFSSSDFASSSPPSLISKFNLPIKKILYVIPNSKGIAGIKEQNLFQQICPVSAQSVATTARIVLSHILAGCAEKNMDLICQGISLLQHHGFKAKEIAAYGHKIKRLIKKIESAGGLGVGMSSFGPGIFILQGNFANIKSIIENDQLGQCLELEIRGGTNE